MPRLDPYYQDVLECYGREHLESAGWINEEGVEHAPWQFGFPENKLEPVRENSVVLLTTGAFSPVHEGHIRMMEAAARELQGKGYHIMGGYFSPSHDEYVDMKSGGQAAKHHEKRIAEMEEALRESPFMVDPWEARYCSGKVNFTTVIERIQRALLHFYGKDVMVAYVFGSDNASFSKAFTGRGLGVCVEREGWAVPEELKSIQRVTFTGPVSSQASSKMRAKEQPERPEQKGIVHYHVRDDLKPGLLDEGKLEGFKEGFFRALEKALPPSRIHAHSLSDQLELLDKKLNGRRSISLDVNFKGDVNLEVSRLFEICEEQKKSLGLHPRVEARPIEEQARGLRGKFVLVDDDSATGQTLSSVREVLKGVEIEEFIPLLSLCTSDPAYDVVDLRDFVLGYPQGGLSVRTPQGVRRAIYAFPYVSPVTRAKIPQEHALRFSAEVWKLNANLYQDSGLRLKDLSQGSVSFLYRYGFQEETLAHDAAAWHHQTLALSLSVQQPQVSASL